MAGPVSCQGRRVLGHVGTVARLNACFGPRSFRCSQREYLADASGALLTRYPEGLASALEKISSHAQPMKHASHATAHLFISDPFKGGQKRGLAQKIGGLFHSHPPAEDRIAKLRGMEV